MADSEGPQSHTLCFLSTLLSQKVPEKSDVVLRCMISGQPKPEVTWYKNGQAIDECGIASSYEFFENQYVHVLHLSCCSRSDAAVYQISARSCLGMICCSASVEVECPSENPQLPPNLGDDRDTGWKHGTETSKKECTHQTHEKEHPCKEEESMSSVALSADSSPPKFNCLCSPQLLANDNLTEPSSENPLDEETRQTAEVHDSNNTEENFLNSNDISPNHQWTAPPSVSLLMDDNLNNDGPNGEILNSSHQKPKAQKYISFSLPLSEATACIYPGECALVNKQPSPPVSSEDSDSDYELCPEISLTYTEEFSDDDLEYLECSDVMTDYSNAVWQRSLQGTEHVFLLESDDEEMELSEYILGGCEHFLSEMGCGPRVSGDTGPMDATTGFCAYHSQSQEVGVRSSGASRHSLSSLRTGRTLPLRSHQDGMAMVTGQESCPLPIASEAAENDCPGIQEETRDSHQAGEEFASDNLLTMDKAAPELEMKPLSGGSERSGMKQSLEIVVEERAEKKDLGSQRSSQKSARVWRPQVKGKSKKLALQGSAAEGARSPPPKGPPKAPLMRSNQEETPYATAGIPGWNSCFLFSPAEQDTKTLQLSAGSLSKEGDTGFQRKGLRVSNLVETSQTPDQSDHPQGMVRERISPSQMPAFLEPTGEETPLTGTTKNFLANMGRIHKEDASLAQYLEVESCPQDPQQGEKQERNSTTTGGSWEDLELEPSTPKTNSGNMSLAVLSVHHPQDASTEPRDPEALSVAFPEPTDTALALENVCSGSRDREAACVVECFEASDQGTCYDTMDSPAGTLVDKYLPQDICSVDSELTEGQSKVCDLYSPDDKTLAVLFQTRGSESPQSTGDSSKDRNTAESPLFVSTFTWNMSQEATKRARRENLAKVENSTAILSPTVSTDWERLSPQHSGWVGEAQPLSVEKNSFVHFGQGDESPRICASNTTDTPANHSSVVNLPQEKPMALTAVTVNAECLQEAEKAKGIPAATKSHPARYVASVSVNNLPSGILENSPGAPDESNPKFPSSGQSGHVLSDLTTESTKESLCLASSVSGVRGSHAPLLLEGEGSCNNFLLQTDNQARNKSQTVVRADQSLEEDFQEKGSETEKGLKPESQFHQGSFLADDFQESLLPTSTIQDKANPVPLEHSLMDCRDARGHRSGQGADVSMAAEAMVAKSSQALSNVPSLSEILQEESEETGQGNWKLGKKLRIITLEASVSEIWPPTQVMELEYKEAEPSPILPDWPRALLDAPEADASLPEQDRSDMAVLDETGSALADHRQTHEGSVPASTTHQASLSSQDLNQPGFLDLSMDAVDEKELWVTDSLSEVSGTGWKDNANSMSQDQVGTQVQVDHLTFFKQFLALPGILESSVDPIDDTGGMECPQAEKLEPSDVTLEVIREKGKLTDGNLDQRVEVPPAILQIPCPQNSEETIPNENIINEDQVDSKRVEAEPSQHSEIKVEAQSAIWQDLCPDAGEQRIPSACSIGQTQAGSHRSSEEAERSTENKAGSISPASSPPNSLTVMTQVSAGVDSHNSASQSHDQSASDLAEPHNHQHIFSDSKERGIIENEFRKHAPSSRDLTQLPRISSPEGNLTHVPIRCRIEELKGEKPQVGEPELPSSSDSTSMTLAFISGECESEKSPGSLQEQEGSTLSSGRKPRKQEKASHIASQIGKLQGAQPVVPGSEEVKKKQETPGGGHLAEGVKKKILSRVAALRLKLEEKENARKNSGLLRKIPKLEKSLSHTDEKKDPKKAPCKREGKAPVLLKKIQAEMFPDHSGNVKLSCQFAEIHEDSTIRWTKDSTLIAQLQRSAGDNSAVSLAIVQASQKDQGLYNCCIKNSFGKVTAEFNLTAEVLKQLSSHPDIKGCEEIEFSQLIFREDFLNDSYFGGHLRGQIATEELHFGEGVHRKAFRSTVMRGLTPVFQPGHACVLKVHNAVAYGTRNNDELIQRNYKLAAQECYVQNTARHYAKIYAAEVQPLEGFGEVPEIIPIFLIHRPENNIPYATVEEELIGEFVKYSIRDGKEINFLRRESEAGQKCCTFQHWVYQKTSGCLLVTDMQGVGMKLTDVGIATLAKGYKGFKGNCSMTFIDQFKALHQCNKYCKMLGLQSLQSNNQKPKKPSAGKSKVQTNSLTVKKPVSGAPAEKKS